MAIRLLVFGFGAATYAFFVVVVLWSVAFVGDLGLPKSIDAGREPGNWPQSLAIDVALILLFGVQHSVMARAPFKAWLARMLPAAVERSVYVLASSVALAVAFILWQPVPIALWNYNGGWQRSVLVALFWIGWAMVLVSTFLVNHFDLFGLRQVGFFLRGAPYVPVPFKDSLVYRHVRHPLMASFLVAFWATPRMTVGHLVFAAGMTLYILVGIWFEEKDLVAAYGAKYAEYRAKVPMLLPWRRSS
jgi:methanethiol S-methyltransferase